MNDNDLDDRGFTDEQLQAALKSVGEEARRIAFAAGQPIVVLRKGVLLRLYADGREEIVADHDECKHLAQ